MASESIQGRVDGDVWAAIRGDGTNTEALKKVVEHWRATQGENLSDIAPTPAAAVAVLMRSHELLNQIVSGGAFVATGTPVDAQTPSHSTAQTDPLKQADEW